MGEYVVLGDTSGFHTSRNIIGRYKGEEELRDVFITKRLTNNIKKKLLVFKIEKSKDAFYLITFDIKLIKKADGSERHASREYLAIQEEMEKNFCGKIDYSTYICTKDLSDIPRRYTSFVKMYRVKPHDEKTMEYVRDAMEQSVLDLIDKIKRAKLRGAGKIRAIKLTNITIDKKAKEYIPEETLNELKVSIERLKWRLKK